MRPLDLWDMGDKLARDGDFEQCALAHGKNFVFMIFDIGNLVGAAFLYGKIVDDRLIFVQQNDAQISFGACWGNGESDNALTTVGELQQRDAG